MRLLAATLALSIVLVGLVAFGAGANAQTAADATFTNQTSGSGGGGGANPAGIGSEINARLDGTTFQAVTGSSTATGGIALVNQSAAVVPFSVTGAAAQSANLLEVTANGGAAGGLFKVTSDGSVVVAAGGNPAKIAGPTGVTGNRIEITNDDRLRVISNALELGNGREAWINSASLGFGRGFHLYWSSNSTDPAQGSHETGLSDYAPGVVSVDTAGENDRLGWVVGGSTCFVGSDQTNATTTSQTSACYVTGTTPIALAGGKSYRIDCYMPMANSVAADGAVIDFDGGTATATAFRASMTAFDSALAASESGTALANDFNATTFTGDGYMEFRGFLEVNVAGTFQPRFFMNAATTGTLTLYKGASCKLTRLN